MRGAELPDLEKGIAAIREVWKTLPSRPGVYRMQDSRGDVLYVGKARTLKSRVTNYTQAVLGAAQGALRDTIGRNDLATLPENESLSVIPTPEYLRNVMPFAAYFQPAKFDARRRGIYIVTPSVDGDPRAMMEHNWASISNTSIHEAYPGHHLQLALAARHPSLTRAQVEAPEFVEGWGMYT